MSETTIFRPRLSFEREFGQHRNWWVRGDALTGNAIKVLLALLSHDQSHEINQTELQNSIGLGQSAWRSAKENLMQAGFLIEIRDRYPSNARRADGTPCGGQKRFRLVLQDPPEGTLVELQDAIVEANEPVSLRGETAGQSHSRKSRVASRPTLENQEWAPKPQVAATLENQESAKGPVDNLQATLENQESFIGREEDGIRDGIKTTTPIPSQSNPAHGVPERGDLDAQLNAIHPTLSYAAIAHQVRGRVDIASLDLALACIEILNANKKPGGVTHPAAYVAKSLVADPRRWVSSKPYLGLTELERSLEEPDNHRPTPFQDSGCAAGQHDWGDAWLAESDRGYCVRARCNTARRRVDADYAAIEARMFEGSN
ncbi:hypothetical protein [Leucobacter aridicollis]|uniref:hypothetical protein n=1 Tax=Leucobacter aridicollis TaxID=283878 RepID=UPI0021041C88|nr:hypothetical protein [Leucobacter aridicollis]UTX53313.1 hypothetical protein KI794_00645 [Leucobacter aridicollis]